MHHKVLTGITFSDVFIVVLLLSAVFTTAIIPPFQSPDEFDHIKRAYLLSKAEVILDAPDDGGWSGGMIDTGFTRIWRSFSHTRSSLIRS